MKARYTILMEPEAPAPAAAGTRTRGRAAVGARATAAGAAPAIAAATASPVIKTETLKPGEARELARERKVAAVAPVMPMRLIEPTKRGPARGAAAAAAWGITAVKADTSPFTGKGIVVAVLDTGIDAQHEAFAGVTLDRRNFTQAPDHDEHGHGTHCAGTIFGRDVGGKRIGVARGVQRALIGKVLGEGGGGSDRVAQAINWAIESGAHVISMSLGIDFPGFVDYLVKQEKVPVDLATSMALEAYRANVQLFEAQARFLEARGAFAQASMLVAAAGNESRREVNKDYEIAVSPPAVATGIVSVAALGQVTGGWQVADFSNTGARVSGPGVGVLSAKPKGGLQLMSGTSMATPHVAGVAALWGEKLLGENDLRNPQWADRLLGAATKVGMKAGFDPADIGSGMVQAPQS